MRLADGADEPSVDLTALRADVRTAMRFLDDVLDVNAFALPDNREASQDLRRLGLGVMGMADMLVKLGLPYDSHEGRNAVSDVMRALAQEALAASEALAAERGAYPLYDRMNTYELPEEQWATSGFGGPIEHAPRRNVAFLTVAPTGTTSMLMGVSSGIEPIFSPFVWRRIGGEYRAMLHPLFVADLDTYLHFLPAKVGGVQVVREVDAADGDGVDLSLDLDGLTTLLQDGHGSVAGLDWIPAEIRTRYRFAHDVAPLDHVRMQGAVQVAFDECSAFGANSLSKTINLPNSATVDDVKGAYLAAYQTGCKGITVYRDGSRGLQVLNTSKDGDDMADVDAETETAEIMADPELAGRLTGYLGRQAETRVPWVRPADLPSVTHSASLHDTVNGGTRKFLVVVGSDVGRPVEVILISGKAGEEINADSEALGRLTSIALQHGVPPQAIIDTLRGINGGLYGSFGGALVGSKADLIAVALTRAQGKPQDAFRDAQVALAEQPPVVLDAGDWVFMGVLPEGAEPGGEGVVPSGVVLAGATRCPVCENVTLMRQDGCTKCVIGDCGYSKC